MPQVLLHKMSFINNGKDTLPLTPIWYLNLICTTLQMLKIYTHVYLTTASSAEKVSPLETISKSVYSS
jgi:hypothetical protein